MPLTTEISAASQRSWVEFDVKHLLGVCGEHGFHVGSGFHVESVFHVQNWDSALDILPTYRFELVSQGGKDEKPYVYEKTRDQSNTLQHKHFSPNTSAKEVTNLEEYLHSQTLVHPVL